MPGVRKKKRAEKFQAWYHVYGPNGRRRKRMYFTGTTSARETLALAHEYDLSERRIAMGLEAAPGSEYLDESPYSDTVNNYLE
jgi:hypothetical protein